MAEDQDFRYPIGKEDQQEEYALPFNEQLKRSLIDEIKMLPSNLEYAIQNLDAAQLEIPYRTGGWTVQQLVHHVADSHINAYVRFKLGLTEENPVIKPYDQDAWAKLPDTKLPINISITLLFSLHARWCELMDDMDETEWQRTIYHPEREIKISLWELLKSYAWHGKHHTAHILKLRERMNWK
ncbi:MAG TPA: putative metal-dependent hydrolase [Hanamia sp.]|nr:putative metal-dependent hydrolase [Hanamia sp.]